MHYSNIVLDSNANICVAVDNVTKYLVKIVPDCGLN